jgi:hypothetical protein
VAATVRDDKAPLPPGAEDRIGTFAESIALAISVLERQQQRAASRARIVRATDAARPTARA